MADELFTKGTELSVLAPTIWSAAFYPTLLETLPFNDSIARDYEGEIRALGDTVNITTFPQFGVAEDIQEGQKVDADSVTATRIQLLINKMLVKDFVITDLAMIQTIDASTALRDLAFHSIMKRMQQIIISTIVPSAASPDHTASYASGTTLALVDILGVKKLLDLQNVPDDGRRNMTLGANQWNDIFNITGLTSRDFIDGQSVLMSGSLPGRVLGFVPKFTTEAGAVAYFYHPVFMEMAVQKSLEVKVFDQGVSGVRSVRINSTLLFGVVQASSIRVATIS